MKLEYNVTGSERKSLVGTISTILNASTKYLGAPTFAYEVGDYHIDKVGTLTGPDNLDLEDALHQEGFDADGDSREYDQPDTYESGLGGMGALDEFPDIDQHHPGRYADPSIPFTAEMQKQIDDYFFSLPMTEEEELGLGRTRRENFQGENGMQASDVPDADELEDTAYGLVVSIPREAAPDTAIENLKRMLQAKGTLIKKAVGADNTDIDVDDEVIRFPWFDTMPDPEMVSAVSKLIGKLLAEAKAKKRIVVKEEAVVPENEKYAFRCYLLRLGFIGDEYKAARKTLLRNLSGSSAFKSGNPKVQELVEHINADASLYDDVMSLQDKEVADNE